MMFSKFAVPFFFGCILNASAVTSGSAASASQYQAVRAAKTNEFAPQGHVTLDQLQEENVILEERCLHTAKNIEVAMEHTELLKSASRKRLKAVRILEAKLHETQAGFKLAEEHAAEVLNSVVVPDPDIEFLKELNEKASEAAKKRLYMQRIRAIAPLGESPTSLIQMDEGSNSGDAQDAEAELPKEKHQSRLISAAARRHAFLVKQEEELNATLAEAKHMEVRLMRTSRSLRQKQGKLAGMLRAGQNFARLVGTPGVLRALGTRNGVSLLQTEAVRHPHGKSAPSSHVAKPVVLTKRAAETSQLHGQDLYSAAKMYDNVESQAKELRLNVVGFQNNLQDWLMDLREKCQEEIQESHAANLELAQENADTAQQVEYSQDQINSLHKTATTLQSQVLESQGMLRALLDNVTAGKDFVETALAESAERMQNSKEMKALAQLEVKLAAQSEEHHKQAAWEQARKQVQHQRQRGKLALLQTPRPVTVVVNDLEDKLMALRDAGIARKDRLQALCDKTLHAEHKNHEAMLEEQGNLKQQMRSHVELNDRLAAAVEHLRASLKLLKSRLRSLSLFSKVMGERARAAEESHAAASFSLLQLSPRDNEEGSSLGAHVAQLQQKLASIELQNRRQQATLKAKYAEALNKARQDNVRQANDNMKLFKALQDISETSRRLRHEASEQAESLQTWQEDWDSLGANFSTMLEVAQQAINSVTTLGDAPELSILNDLDAQDHQSRALESAKHRFDDILDGSRLSLLQVRETPRALLHALDAGISDLEAQEEHVEADMKERFDKQMAAEISRKEALEQEGLALKAKVERAEKLKGKLLEFLMHSASFQGEITKKATAVRTYVGKLGSRALPGANETTVPPTVPFVTETTATTTIVHVTIPVKSDDEDIFNLDIDSELEKVDSKVESRLSGPAPTLPTTKLIRHKLDLDDSHRSADQEVRAPITTEKHANAQKAELATATSESDGKPWLSWLSR